MSLPDIQPDIEDEDWNARTGDLQYNGMSTPDLKKEVGRRLSKSNSLTNIIPPKFQTLQIMEDLNTSNNHHIKTKEGKIVASTQTFSNHSLPPPNKFAAFFAKLSKRSTPDLNSNKATTKITTSAKYQTNTPQYIPKSKPLVDNHDVKEKKQRSEKRETRLLHCAKIWKESDVIINWQKRKTSKKIKELIWWGVPSNIRSQVWPLFVGNKLSLTRELFDIYMAQAGRTKLRDQENNIAKESTVHLIPIDLPRTFPHLSFFHPDGPLYSHLRDVLEAYACYRPDIGYVQGMSYLASVLLLYLDELDSFICLANLLNRPLLKGFYKCDQIHINEFMRVLICSMEVMLPNLHRHFAHLQITPEVYIMDWVMTLFSKSFELDVVSRIWDCVLYEGEYFIIKVGLGLLKVSENLLLSNNYEECLIYLTHLPSIEEELLFDAISSMDYRSCKVMDEYILFLSETS